MATYYTKVMERVQSKGDSFVTTEIDRLERLLGKVLFLLDIMRSCSNYILLCRSSGEIDGYIIDYDNTLGTPNVGQTRLMGWSDLWVFR